MNKHCEQIQQEMFVFVLHAENKVMMKT